VWWKFSKKMYFSGGSRNTTGSYLKQQIEPMLAAHNSTTLTILEYIDQITELAKDIEKSVPPGDGYDENQKVLEPLEDCVKEYVDMLRVIDGHRKAQEKIIESTNVCV